MYNLISYIKENNQKMEPKVQHRKKKHIAKPEYKNLNAFKAQQKHYKLYQGQQTDFSTLFEPSQQDFVQVDGYQVCQLPFPQGAYYVKNFTPYSKVIEIGYFGLNHYWRRPYRTNLDSRQELYEKKQQNIQQQINKNQSPSMMQPAEQIQQIQQPIKAQNKENQNGYYFNEKIRWANVGYQYDWTLRKYPEMKTPIHQSIQDLSDSANKLYNSIEHIKKEYQPESAIVNYYGVKDYMTGHLDDAEIDQQSPIYSFSFGLSCIFLMGGRSKEQKPTAIRLNSGDLLIMAGQSRKCYHGVPRVLQHSFVYPNQQQENRTKQQIKVESAKQEETLDKNRHNSYQNIKNYFKSHRININIRQVYPNKQ